MIRMENGLPAHGVLFAAYWHDHFNIAAKAARLAMSNKMRW